MRNLKKVIALVAVFAMLVSTVAFATTFSDVKDDDNYAEAIKMLSNLGILTGDDQDGDGVMDFRPNDTITRAEVAAIVGRVQNLNNLAQTGTQFTDVTSSHWASGYVAQAAGKGIINGNGDGTFAPEANVKFQDVVKMFVRTIGYEPYVNANGGYPAGDLAAANRCGVLDGVINSGNEAEATRGQVAQIAYNALDTPLMDRYSYGKDEEFVIYNGKGDYEFQSLLTQYLGVKKFEGVVTSNRISTLTGTNSINTDNKEEIEFDFEGVNGSDVDKNSDYYLYEVKDAKTIYAGDTNAADYLGYDVNAYIKETGRSGEYELISITPSNRNKTVEFTLDKFYEYDATANKVEYYKNDSDTTKITLDSNVVALFNGAAYANKAELANKVFGAKDSGKLVERDSKYSGKVTFIDNNTYNGYDVIKVEIGSSAVVDEVSAKGRITFKEAPKVKGQSSSLKIDFSDDDTSKIYKLTKDGKAMDWSELKEWDVVSVVSPGSSVGYYDIRVIGSSAVDGTITSRKASDTSADGYEYRIGGNNYEVAAGCYQMKESSGWDVGTAGMFYVDEYGKIVAYDKNGSTTSSTSSDAYAYVLNATDDADTWGNNNIRVQILDKDGKVYDAYLADTVKLEDTEYAFGDGSSTTDPAAAAAAITGSTYKDSFSVKVKDIKDAGTLAKKMVNKLITYKADSKGDISTITFAQFGANAEDNSFQLNSYASTYEYDEDNKEIRIGGSTGTRYDVTEDTVVFFIKGSGDDTFTAGEKYVTGTASKSASKVGTVASLAEAKAVTGKPAAVFDDDNGVASVVVLWNSTGGISPSNSVAVISSVGTARIDEEDVESVEYYMNGELKTSYTDPDYNGFKFADDVKEGDIVKLALSADGTTITDASKVFIADRDYNKAGVDGALKASTIGSINNVIYGPVYDYTSMNKRIRVAKGADFTNLQAIKANNANVYVFDPNRRNNKIEVGDASDVEVDKTLRDGTPEITVTGSGKTGVAAGEKALGLMDYAVGVEYDGDIIDVVIYKAFDFDWKFAD